MNLFRFQYWWVLATSLSLALCPVSLAWSASVPDQLDVNMALGWHSKYVTRGRDNLEEGGSFSPEINLAYGDGYASAWFAIGDSVDYREMNLSAGYIFAVEDLELDLGYTWLWFDHENTDDHELTAVLSYQGLEWLVLELDYVYATRASGGALDVVLTRDFLDGAFTFSPHIVSGFDFGYFSPAHDGLAYIEIGAEFSYPLMENMELQLQATRTFAREDIKRDNLGDLSWVGFGLSVDFH